MDAQERKALFQEFGARGGEVDELARYTENLFLQDQEALPTGVRVPLDDEPFVDCWRDWEAEARERGAFAVLREHLPQLRFPVREGISKTEPYRSATLRGTPADEIPEATGLGLERPELVELELYPSLAGRVPVLRVRGRAEFVLMVQALAKRNEPVPIADSQGAAMIAGLINWERIRRLRRAWEARPVSDRETASWNEEFARVRAHRELFQDRLVILSDGPYSAVSAAAAGFDEDSWRERSYVIRREHECCHYFTRRLLGTMRNNLHDELIADDAGLVAALGRFDAALFRRFLGLEDEDGHRPGGRLEVYRDDLSDGAFGALGRLVRRAAANLERWDTASTRSLTDRAHRVLALASLGLAELASEGAGARLNGIWTRFAEAA